MAAAIMVAVAIVVTLAKIAITVSVPAMVVFPPPPITLPVALKVPLSIMARPDPACAWIGCAGPVSVVPLVMVADWIPVAFHPDKFRTWSWRRSHKHPWGRGWPDSDSDGNLSEHGSSGE